MKTKFFNSKQLNSQSGALTIDFVFGLVLILGLSAILMALSFTMVMAEVSQYIAFSTSRSYFGGHVNEERQKQLSLKKFQQLMSQPLLSRLFNNGWFKLELLDARNFEQIYQPETESDIFIGARLVFKAPVLDLQLPFYGSTAGEKGAEGFQTHVNSFLGREPTFEECRKFTVDRWQAIQSEFGTNIQNPKAYVPIMDNGC